MSREQKLLIEMKPGDRTVINGRWVLRTKDGNWKIDGVQHGLPEANEQLQNRKVTTQW
jgi:hypothetical protein